VRRGLLLLALLAGHALAQSGAMTSGPCRMDGLGCGHSSDAEALAFLTPGVKGTSNQYPRLGLRIPAISNLAVTCSVGGGKTLAAGTYYYRITQWSPDGDGPLSNEVSGTLSGAGHCDLTWTNDGRSQSEGYILYRRTSTADESTTLEEDSLWGDYTAASSRSDDGSLSWVNPVDDWSSCPNPSCVPFSGRGMQAGLGPNGNILLGGDDGAGWLHTYHGVWLGTQIGTNDTTGAWLGTFSNHPLRFFVNQSEATTAAMTINADGTVSVNSLKTTGAASGKKVVCVDLTTGRLFPSSSGTDCSN